MTLIAFTGRMGAGKSFAAGVLAAAGFRRTKFAGPLKSMLAALHADAGLNAEQSRARIEGALKEVFDRDVSEHVSLCDPHFLAQVMCDAMPMAGIDPDRDAAVAARAARTLAAFIAAHWQNRNHTPRAMMQQLGTEWGRRRMGEDFWVELWSADAAAAPGARIVVDDCRFANEARAVRALRGRVVRIECPHLPPAAATHESEVFALEPDMTIVNDGGPAFAETVRRLAT